MNQTNQPNHFHPIPGIPKRDDFAPIIHAQMDEYYALTDPAAIGKFREREIETLAEKIRTLPRLPFNEAREREMLRLTQYYEAFATLFGIDLREIARTRTQINATVMYTSPILLQAMFDDKGGEDAQGLTFFESRIQAGGFSFNATSINIIEGYPMSFSVLKRILQDDGGDYEIDYPAVSLPREAFLQLQRWHASAYPDLPLAKNPILTFIADAFSYRIHDWIHQAILYDANSASRIFQKWSDDSYFVEHFFHDPAMINYEFMSDKIHYLVWGQLFDEHASIKEIMLENVNVFLRHLDAFEAWHTNPKLANFLGYVGLRGLFNILSIDDLKTHLTHNPRFAIIHELLPEQYRGYLAKLYEPVDQLFIPFRKGQNTRISLQQILEEYAAGLREEFQAQKLISISSELWKMGTRGDLTDLLHSIPESIAWQINDRMDIRFMDPRVLILIDKLIQRLGRSFIPEALDPLLARIEIDPGGYFYLRIDQDEVDPNSFITVPYQKEAILIQLPWDYSEPLTVILTRSQNMLTTQIGASDQVTPGGILLVNVENERLAKGLLNTLTTPDSKSTFDFFWQRLNTERARGHIALGDAYPYDWAKAQSVFNVPQECISLDAHQRQILRAGYYQTRPAQRRAARSRGPISMNSNNGNAQRRILYGCVAENHVRGETSDIFPVDSRSFDRFYQADRLSLHPFKITPIFAKRTAFDSIEHANHAVRDIFETLSIINDVIMYGFRGKPQKVTFDSLFKNMD
jgi:hypothetical protein